MVAVAMGYHCYDGVTVVETRVRVQGAECMCSIPGSLHSGGGMFMDTE